jgi:hypothetical protein
MAPAPLLMLYMPCEQLVCTEESPSFWTQQALARRKDLEVQRIPAPLNKFVLTARWNWNENLDKACY